MVFIVIVIVFSTHLGNAAAQSTTTIPFYAGTTSQQPSINGQWEAGEWGNTETYNLTIGSHANLRPNVRLLHNNSSLYGLVDVPSDTGGTFIDSNGQKSWGWVALDFYYGTFFPAAGSTQPFFVFYLSTNQTGPYMGLYVYGNSSIENKGFDAQRHSIVTTSLSTTTLANTKHRIWEFSLQLFPYIVPESLTQNATNIGFNVRAVDSGGNMMYLVGESQPGRLIFTEMPLSEVSNIVVMIPLAVSISLFLLHQRRKYPQLSRLR